VNADEPLDQIKAAVTRDRQRACGLTTGFVALHYNKDLEAVAQAYARSENAPVSPPPNIRRIKSFLGAGDPEAQAINRAYQHGAGQAIGNCINTGPFSIQEYGVGFVRHNDRSVDVVTIVFGLNQI
jgi:hypothetical protein